MCTVVQEKSSDRLFQFTVLFIHGIAFLRRFGDHNFEKEAAVCGYHMYILYSVDSHARRGHVTSRIRL